MPKGKKTGNGFMSFVMKWKSQNGPHMPLNVAIGKAGKIWETMSSEERAYYKDSVQKQKFGEQTNKTTNFAYTVEAATVLTDSTKEEDKERKIKRNIESIVKNSVLHSELATKYYYFIMANYFSKELDTDQYIPAEISVSQFSLKHGITRKYHTFINPGDVLYGNSYEAHKFSQQTHGLPIPPDAMGDTDLVGIYEVILKFIQDEGTEYPHLYTTNDTIPMVSSVLNYLKNKSSRLCNIHLNIYPIQYLLFVLKDAASELSEVKTKPCIFDIYRKFDRDEFEYCPGLGCQYHDEKDNNKYCTQSYVTRWGFTFADIICKDIAIDLKQGRHIPIQINVATVRYIPTVNGYLFSHKKI